MSKRTPTHHPMLLTTTILLMITLLTGCTEDERVVEVAREAADRQAEQNRQIAHQNQEIAQTTNRLVEADGRSRTELVALQRDLQVQQAEVARQRDALEAERREQAEQRWMESMLAPAIESLGALLVCALLVAFGCYLARGLRTETDANPEINELLVMDLVSDEPRLLPSLPTPGVGAARLPELDVFPDETELSNPEL